MLTAPSVGGPPPGGQMSGKPNGNNNLDALDGGRREAVVTYIANRRSLSLHRGLTRAPLHRRHREATGASMGY